jgi:hypothetical protein
MTDIIITTAVPLRRLRLPRFELPKLGIGRGISEVSNSIVQAFEMAYVAPFSAMQRKPSIVLDEDLEGRGSKW